MEETQKDDTEKQAEIRTATSVECAIGTPESEANDRIQLLHLRTEVIILDKLKDVMNDRQIKLRATADAIQEKLDGQQSFFEGPSGGDVSSVVQDNQQ